VTEVSADSVNVHVKLVVHEPALVQPVKLEPDAGAAVSVTLPFGMFAVQVAPQLIPAGDEVTVPVPPPALLTVSADVGMGANDAVTVVSADRLNVQVGLVVHVPALVHPVNVAPASGVAVSVTLPWVRVAVHVAPQLMPAGEELTEPVPPPDFETVRLAVGAGLNAALTLVFALNVNVHTGLVVQLPALVQPANVEPAAGLAVSVMLEPAGNDAEHVAPQLIAAGFDVTEPLPPPLRETLSCACVPAELVPTL
jgi:hypothetical protein